MLLSEDKSVVDALIKILENYESLEYDEEWSAGNDFLKVRKKNPAEKLDFSLTADPICRNLGKVTNRSFFPANAGSGDRDFNRDFNKDWSSFNIHESKKR